MRTLDKTVGIAAMSSFIVMFTVMSLSIGSSPLIPYQTAQPVVDGCTIALSISALYAACRWILKL